jgi:DNA-binding NtrC family response regulator
MKRILIVDDEPAVLMGVCRALRGRRHEWEAILATDPHEACARMDMLGDINVLITDLAMPNGGGEVVLRHARDHHPHMARIILSGNLANTSMSRQTIPLAHRFLEKPCPATRLQETIDWVIAVRPEELIPPISDD